MQDDLFEFDKTPVTENKPVVIQQDYEKLSYGKVAYKRVQRLRRKGKRRGIKVPYLGYELSKPEKPRIVFWIIAIVSAILLVGILVGVGFLFNELVKSSSDFNSIGDALKALFSPEIFMATAGLSAIPAVLLLSAVLILFFILLLPLLAIIYMCSFIREAFYMAKCSKEEFAKGYAVSSRIFRLVVTLVTVTAIFIVLLIYLPNARVAVSLVYVGVLIVLGGLLALLIVEKVKNKKWFETLEEDKKKNFLAHDGALRQVNRRLRHERQMWDDITRL